MNNKITYRGTDINTLPIEKTNIDDEWLCHLRNGTISVMIDLKTRELQGDNYFLVHDDTIFRINTMSENAELEVYAVSHDDVISLYPNLGSEANAGLYSQSVITTESADCQMLSVTKTGFELLSQVIMMNKMKEYDKMIINVLSQIYLTFYNLIDSRGTKTTTQSFRLISEMGRLFDDPETYRHRDTQYFADRLNISVRYLYEVCQNEAGQSAKALINESITSKIRHAILTTHLSFKEIADMFNFPDQTAFTQFFKRNTGMTPTEFVRKYK